MERKSNYEAVRESWRKRFLAMDCTALARRFHLKLDGDFLYLTYFSHPCAIDRRTARIARLDRPGAEIGFNMEMTFFNMFHYAVENPRPSGEMVPFRSVKRAYPFESAYRSSILEPLAQLFAGRADALQAAFQRLGAEKIARCDAGGRLDVIPGLKLDVLFWDGDDEFPAQANMLFDSNITDFMHEENVVGVASDAAAFLAEAANLPAPGEMMGAEL